MLKPLTPERLHEVAHKTAEEYFQRVCEGIDYFPKKIGCVTVGPEDLEGKKLSKSKQKILKQLGFKKVEGKPRIAWYIKNPGKFTDYNGRKQEIAAEATQQLLTIHMYKATTYIYKLDELIKTRNKDD